jgi:anti-anti-sigma regulatory factor
MPSPVDPPVPSGPGSDPALHPVPHVLPDCLDLTRAQELRDELSAALLRGTPLQIDASAVERLSTPCAQVLLAAGRAAAAGPAPLSITDPSDAFRAALADLGLQAEFSSWMN